MLIYAERYGDQVAGEDYIAEKGIFLSYEEFVPYRQAGWSGTPKTNTATDALIAALESKGAEE